MHFGDRHRPIAATAGVLLGIAGPAGAQTPLCGGEHPGNPELVSGSASCVHNQINGAGETIINLGDASVIRWDHLGLQDPASSLTFNWTGGAGGNRTVVNRVTGGDPPAGFIHNVAGSIQFAGGNLVVVNPNSALNVSGTISAGSVLLSTHHLTPSQETALLAGQAAEFTNSSKPLTLQGSADLEATAGDLVIAGWLVTNSSAGGPGNGLRAPLGSVRLFGGRSFRLETGGAERLTGLPGGDSGSVTSSKNIRGGTSVEIRAHSKITNAGVIEANSGMGQVFLRVDDGSGTVKNDGLITGFAVSDVPITGDGRIEPDEGDIPSVVSTGISRFPSLQRPGEKPSQRKVVVYESAPTTGSASAQRDRANEARRSRVARTQPLARGRSFFGVRGGSGVRKKR